MRHSKRGSKFKIGSMTGCGIKKIRGPAVCSKIWSLPATQRIQEKFDVNHGNKDWVLKSIEKKWKDWKSELKLKHYETHTTNEERLKDLDIRVVPKQWSILVSYWNSLEGMERCKIGKHNRALQRLNHTAGSKSFARIFREKTDERSDGEEPSRTDIFIATHTRDEQPMDEALAEIIVFVQPLCFMLVRSDPLIIPKTACWLALQFKKN
ncbi:hypothetical protein L1049_007078 [Liquidambar formosana]|uniref:Uncharacterized protein n=1 Tax=Liquidambar formosana TaxID=63359 RepID=A0AAP0RGJ7_LIQFO